MGIDWKNKVVFLNIAVVPLGAATVEILMEQGVKNYNIEPVEISPNLQHITIFDTNEEAGSSLQDKLNKKYTGHRVQFIKGDVSIEDQLKKGFQDVIEAQGYIDVVLNNAGVINDGLEVYAKMINVNFTSLVASTLKSFEIMSNDKGGKGGTIINVTSVLALISCYPLPIYSATKLAILKFSHLVGKPEYLSRTGVRVFTLVLGGYNTPLLHPRNFQIFDKKMEADFVAAVSKLPMQKAEKVAQGIVDVYEHATGGSCWMLTSGRLEDITAAIDKSLDLANVLHIFE